MTRQPVRPSAPSVPSLRAFVGAMVALGFAVGLASSYVLSLVHPALFR